MNNCLIVNMKEEGVNGAVGRVLGIKLKEKIISEQEANNYEKIILDFSEVDFVTSGFAKELFGGLFEAFHQTFKNLITARVSKDNETLRNTIIRAITTAVQSQV